MTPHLLSVLLCSSLMAGPGSDCCDGCRKDADSRASDCISIGLACQTACAFKYKDDLPAFIDCILSCNQDEADCLDYSNAILNWCLWNCPGHCQYSE